MKLEALVCAMRATAEGNSAPAEALGFSLRAFNWSRDIDVGNARHTGEHTRAVIVSCQRDSLLFAFQESGTLNARLNIRGEVLSFELFDFDADGTDELITRQKSGSGTGVYHEEFVIYSFEENEVREIWRGTSRWYADPLDNAEEAEEEEGFIKASYENLLFVSSSTKRRVNSSLRQNFRYDGRNFTPEK